MLRIAVYARVSTSDKGQDTENQLRELPQFVTNKTTEGWTPAGEYIDQASDKNANRPEFQRLFRDAAERKFYVVLFWSLDRFTWQGALENLQHLQRLTGNEIDWWSFKVEYLSSIGRSETLYCLSSPQSPSRSGFAQGKTVRRPKVVVDATRFWNSLSRV
jgi:hypothetical protein